MPNPSAIQLRALRRLAAGERLEAIEYARTLQALRRHGWIDAENNITPAGSALVEQRGKK